VQRNARKFGVTGWVRNCPDGAVELVAEGEKISLEGLIDACRRGPVFAKVDQIDVTWENYTGEFDDFEIAH